GYSICFSLKKSVLYLDMTGTALVAFLLGPWWGAITGLLTNSLVIFLLFPNPDPGVAVLPWALVNVAGGLFWGWLSGRKGFQRYLRSPRVGPFGQLWYLFIFGVLGAAVMSFPSTLIQLAVGNANRSSFGEDIQLVEAFNRFWVTTNDLITSLLENG